MDADGRMIPLVEDDQGEGIKDFIDDFDVLRKYLQEDTSNSKPDDKLYNKLDDIIGKLDFILTALGHHKLINGRWIDITKIYQAPE